MQASPCDGKRLHGARRVTRRRAPGRPRPDPRRRARGARRRIGLRATAAAIILFIVNLVGAGAGPFVVGFLNDRFVESYGQHAIRYSLFALACTMVLGVIFFWLSSRFLAADLARRDRD